MIRFKTFCEEVIWTAPSLVDEQGELERTASECQYDEQLLIQRFHNGKLVSLSDDMWRRMENTDSWDVQTMDDVKALAAEYDRDVDRLIKAFKDNVQLPAAIVWNNSDTPYLVGGNTRLMVAKVLGIRPKVWLI